MESGHLEGGDAVAAEGRAIEGSGVAVVEKGPTFVWTDSKPVLSGEGRVPRSSGIEADTAVQRD